MIRAYQWDVPGIRVHSPGEKEVVVVLTGLTVTGGVGASPGLLIAGIARVTIANCTISENGWRGGIELESSAQARIEGCTVSGNNFGIWLRESSQATIEGCTVSANGCGIWLVGSPQAMITDCAISENERDGIMLDQSAQATMKNNEIFGNGGCGISLAERPCVDTEHAFTGRVTGCGNTIPGPDEPDGNKSGAVCPDAVAFLMAREGGELDRRPAP